MRVFPVIVAARASGSLHRFLAGVFFLVLALVYYLPSLTWLPRGIHEWAQADRLALAFGFYDHGLNFLLPRTLSLASTDGIVGVEFPLVAYLAALGAKVAGRAALVPLYRALTIGSAWMAYYFLFRLVFERTQQFVAALVPGVFLQASPLFAFYAGSFLPDPAGASLVVVATYFLMRYQDARRSADLLGALGLFTLATLFKLSTGIYLGGALGSLLLWGYLQPAAQSLRQRWLLLGVAVAAPILIGGYTLYTHYLNETYQAWVFMATLRPIESMAQYRRVLHDVQEGWQGEYFVPFQYQVLRASGVILLLSVGRVVRTQGLWLAQLGLAALGGVLFLRLLGAQLSVHDYYVLAPFWPGLVLLVALATTQLAQRLARLPALGRHLLFGAVLVALLVPGLRRYRARMQDPYLPFSRSYTYRWMQGGAAQLAAAHVPATATVLVLGDETPNLSLIYFDRRGLTWHPDFQQLTVAAITQRMTETGLDYVILRQLDFKTFAASQPDLSTNLRPVISTTEYVVLQRLHGPPHW